MNCYVLHAYSSTNSGDGLLVREAICLIREVDPSARVTVLALDPDSFEIEPGISFIHPLTGETGTPSRLRAGALSLRAAARGFTLPKNIVEQIENADLVVGVGGGYMRGSNLLEALKMTMAHLPQLTTANGLRNRPVYLPQSVGPFRWGTQGVFRRRAARVLWHVRDDRSLGILDGTASVRRSPDTAVMPIAHDIAANRPDAPRNSADPRLGLVARGLSSTRRRVRKYEANIALLDRELTPELLLQASARGNDDNKFYQDTLGRSATRSLVAGTVSSPNRVEVTVSVRLHGAVQSIRNGIPSIHLSYERKGWGAYEDLGVSKYVHNAFDFDPGLVAAQARELASDPGEFWEGIERSRRSISHSREVLLGDVSTALGRLNP